jgi:hypothetical protein
VLIITCGEPDATAFLAGRPPEELARTLLMSTHDVIVAAERQTPIAETFLMGGPATFAEARRLLLGDVHITVVVAPDPWGPFRGKGFVRARQVVPLILPEAPVAVIELRRGGVLGRVRRATPLPELSRWIRRREAGLLAAYVLQAGIGAPVREMERYSSPYVSTEMAIVRLLLTVPLAFVTLARCLTYIARTETRVRRNRAGS